MMLCDIDSRDDLGAGWVQCRRHPVIWQKGLNAPAPHKCPVALARNYVRSGRETLVSVQDEMDTP